MRLQIRFMNLGQGVYILSLRRGIELPVQEEYLTPPQPLATLTRLHSTRQSCKPACGPLLCQSPFSLCSRSPWRRQNHDNPQARPVDGHTNTQLWVHTRRPITRRLLPIAHQCLAVESVVGAIFADHLERWSKELDCPSAGLSVFLLLAVSIPLVVSIALSSVSCKEFKMRSLICCFGL
jgi:hypothetical protein